MGVEPAGVRDDPQLGPGQRFGLPAGDGDLPGRFAGGQVWVAREVDRANDSVSPVIVGGHDWASAWAIDGRGQNPFAAVPGGTRQRTLAYRFGVNLVMYALTGNYKGDQVHVPAILERLGN